MSDGELTVLLPALLTARALPLLLPFSEPSWDGCVAARVDPKSVLLPDVFVCFATREVLVRAKRLLRKTMGFLGGRVTWVFGVGVPGT